jgi:hypothetical protein
LEQQVAAFGASGRNGGFAMTLVRRNLHALMRKVGATRAKATHLAMRQTLRDIEVFCAAESIDADVTHPGVLTISNGPEQDVRIRQDLEAARRLDLDDFHALPGRECKDLVSSFYPAHPRRAHPVGRPGRSLLRGGPDPRKDRDPRIFRRLEETFRWTFPQLSDVAVDRGWAGPVCGTINCFSSAGFLGRSERIAYALGYAGHGVGPSHLVGRIVSDLLLSTHGELMDLPMVSKGPVPLPPGPLRSGLLNLSERVLLRADDQGSDATPLARLALRILQ